jgi:hypothetical protein
MEDETERVPPARADHGHAMPDRGRGPAPRGADRPVAGGEEIAATERERGNRATGLGTRSLLHEQKLSAAMVDARLVQVDDDLERYSPAPNRCLAMSTVLRKSPGCS